MTRRLLILSASAGAGHTRAGQALEEAAKLRLPGAEVRHVDILDLTGKTYKKAYVESFLQMVNHAPSLWGTLYKASDRVREDGAREKFMRFFDKLEFARFRKFVRDFGPDAILSTHFLPGQVLASGRKKGRDRTPLSLVVTDFDVHAFWVQPEVDRIFVATDELAAVLAGRGVAASKIGVSGIPISQAFLVERDVAELRKSLGVTSKLPCVLVMSGGAGVGSMEESVSAALAFGDVQVLAVAGKNAALEARLQAMRPGSGSRLFVFGFVSTIAELMAVSDVAITKSGGLTTSECLAMGLPMIVRDPIPGQEERNCDFVLEAGAGVKAQGPDSLRYKVGALLSDRGRLSRMGQAARKAGRPGAADQIVAEVRWGFLDPPTPPERIHVFDV